MSAATIPEPCRASALRPPIGGASHVSAMLNAGAQASAAQRQMAVARKLGVYAARQSAYADLNRRVVSAWREMKVRVAIVHYWLVGMRGGERVLEEICRLYPQADIFTHVYDPGAVSDAIRRRTIKTTFIARLPFARTQYQKYLGFMPRALEELDLSGYDLILSSESGPAKGIIPGPLAHHTAHQNNIGLIPSYHFKAALNR